jgi:hypothetical protein
MLMDIVIESDSADSFFLIFFLVDDCLKNFFGVIAVLKLSWNVKIFWFTAQKQQNECKSILSSVSSMCEWFSISMMFLLECSTKTRENKRRVGRSLALEGMGRIFGGFSAMRKGLELGT